MKAGTICHKQECMTTSIFTPPSAMKMMSLCALAISKRMKKMTLQNHCMHTYIKGQIKFTRFEVVTSSH